jgi:hypothetical protein
MEKIIFGNMIMALIRLLEAGKVQDTIDLLDRLRIQIESRS